MIDSRGLASIESASLNNRADGSNGPRKGSEPKLRLASVGRHSTLARAPHKTGDTTAALKTQRRAADLAAATELHTTVAAFQERLAEYEAAPAGEGAADGEQ